MLRCNRIEGFLSWCADKVKDTVIPMSKGALSKIYVNEQKLACKAYYFSTYVRDDDLTDFIKNSNHSLEVQAKLMCLLSLSVDEDYFEKLTQFATIELDQFRRIIVYKHGEMDIRCEHRKFRADKSTTSQTGQPKKTQPTVADKPADAASSEQVVMNRERSTSSTSALTQSAHHHSPQYDPQCARYPNNVTSFDPYLSQHVKEEQQESSYPSSWVTKTSHSGMKNGTNEAERQSMQTLERLETPHVSNQRLTETTDLTILSSFAPRYQTFASTGEPILVEILRKLEYYFLYKCKPELIPLCLRIKEVKENEATFSQEMSSTIKAFFEVSLRMMVATNIREPIKVEQGEIQLVPLLLRDFFVDLKQQQLVEGLDIVIDSIQTRVGSEETISTSTISRVFLELINNISLVC